VFLPTAAINYPSFGVWPLATGRLEFDVQFECARARASYNVQPPCAHRRA
jgi:hypothetical protein